MGERPGPPTPSARVNLTIGWYATRVTAEVDPAGLDHIRARRGDDIVEDVASWATESSEALQERLAQDLPVPNGRS